MMANTHTDKVAAKGQLEKGHSVLQRIFLFLLILFLPLALGAWRDLSGDTFNPRYVARIQDGKTTRHEILLWFGDPQKVNRTPGGLTYEYMSYQDAPALPKRKVYKEPERQSTTPDYLDEEKHIKKPTPRTTETILRRTLIIRFKPDGETVMSHEYKDFDQSK